MAMRYCTVPIRAIVDWRLKFALTKPAVRSLGPLRDTEDGKPVA